MPLRTGQTCPQRRKVFEARTPRSKVRLVVTLTRPRPEFMSSRALKTYVFYCSNHLQPAQFESFSSGLEGDKLQAISLPCSGKVDIPYLIKAFETGGDGVVVVTCQHHECRHLEGNLRARKRAEAVESLLAEIGVGTGRMAVLQCPENGAEQVFSQIKQFLEQLRKLPPVSQSATVNQQQSTAA